MKAAVFNGKHNLVIKNIEKPNIKEDEVVIKVMACGICGTDVHIFNGDEGAAATPFGTVLGHEFSGEIVEKGNKVTKYKIGDRVCVDPNKLCGHCYYCKKAIGHFCENIIGIGTTVNGGFAQYCVVPQTQLYKFLETTSYEEAAMAEPVACCIHGIDLCNIKIDDNVLVIGCGMIGLIMIQLAKLYGASKVVAIDVDDNKCKQAINVGADLSINSLKSEVENELKINNITNITKVIECVGKIETMEQAIHLASKKAIVMLFGLTSPNDVLPIKPFEVFKKELEIKASYINPYTQERAIELIDSKRIDVSSMIYKISSLEELPNILADKQLLRKGKHIINPNM